jgi:hypothetical protein
LAGGLNTYGYVSGNPVNKSDPFGLIEWTGQTTGAVITDIVGAGGFSIELTSECVDGKKAKVNLVAAGPALGLGALVDFSVSDIKVKDKHDKITPSTLNGYFQYTTIGYAMGPGYGAYAIAIGTNGHGEFSKTGATGSGHGEYKGYGLGASSLAGSSTVTNVEYSSCGCEQ